MRTTLFNSLIFAALTSFTGSAYSAPAPMPIDGESNVQSVMSAKLGTKVDLNGADAETIQRELSGVGEAKAKAIIAYRDSNRPFASVDELLEVKGIGKAILERNREKIEAN